MSDLNNRFLGNQYETDKGFPTLTSGEIERLRKYGITRAVKAGELLWEQGDSNIPFFATTDAKWIRSSIAAITKTLWSKR